MIPGQSPLEIHGVRRLNRAVGAELDGGTLDKCTGCHDHGAVIPRHIPWLRSNETVYGSRCLDAFAEGDHTLRGAEGNGLDNIMAGFRTVWHNAISQALIDVGCENSAL